MPNHVAPDHPWLAERPDCFLPGSEEELAEHPEAFVRTAGGIVANGRDPYFAAVARRRAAQRVLAGAARRGRGDAASGSAAQCDGLRCDMAMLMTNEVFARTWGERAGAAPDADYWPTLIARVKAAHPDLLFMAEAYWDMEWTLQQQGFDLCYDKRLYDRLVHDPAESVRGHLQADAGYQERLIRFIENHDEPRAAATFAPAQGARGGGRDVDARRGRGSTTTASSTAVATHIPVFLARGPDEPPDEDLRAFYERLLAGGRRLRTQARRLAAVRRAPGGPTTTPTAASSRGAGRPPARATSSWSTCPTLPRRRGSICRGTTCRVQAGRWPTGSPGRRSSATATNWRGEGLYVGLDPWGAHFLGFDVRRR